jgi:hypothetical protein
LPLDATAIRVWYSPYGRFSPKRCRFTLCLGSFRVEQGIPLMSFNDRAGPTANSRDNDNRLSD